MEIAIDIDDSVPLFAQLIGQIKQAVLSDKVRPGDALPSIRQLANDLDLNNKTVAKAYRLLERDSVIQTKGSRGTFVNGQGKTTVRLMAEMSLARNIHDTLVSPVSFTNDRIEALGISCPSTEMGGDLIDVVDHGEITDLFLADVAGHGLGASIVMGMVKSSIRMGLRKREGLSELLGDLNEVLTGTTHPGLYATLACLRIDPAGRVEYALAGHHHIAHYRALASEVRRLGHRNFPLGLLDGRTYSTDTVAPEPGDLLAVYTDGLNETTNASDTELGHEAIEQTVADLAARPLGEIHQAVFDLVETHGEQSDDRTLLLVRFR